MSPEIFFPALPLHLPVSWQSYPHFAAKCRVSFLHTGVPRLLFQYEKGQTLSPKDIQWLVFKVCSGIAHPFFSKRLQELSRLHGFTPPSAVSVRLQRSRWASRSSSGCISCNFLMLYLPPELVEHILLHELCHTQYMNHGEDFHRRLAEVDPRCTEHQNALRRIEKDPAFPPLLQQPTE